LFVFATVVHSRLWTRKRQQAAAVQVEIVDNENGLSAAAECQYLIPQEGSEFGVLLQLNTDDGNSPAIKPQSGKH
jgi:hypothetical protein